MPRIIYLDIILPREFPNNHFQSRLFVSNTHTLNRTSDQWLKKYHLSYQKTGLDISPIEVTFLRGFHMPPFAGFSFAFLKSIINHRPDIIIINRYDSATALAVFVLTRLLPRRPLLYFYSELWLQPRTFWYNLAWPAVKYLIRAADRHYVIGSRQRDFLIAQKALPSKIITARSIPYAPAIPAKNLVSALKIKYANKSNIHLLYLGRIIPYKGLIDLLQAFNILASDYPGKFTLTVVGGGNRHNKSQYSGRNPNYDNRCRQYAKKYLPSSTVTFAGYQTNPHPFYTRADLLVMPNIITPHDNVPAEAWGRVLPECLQAATPVLATTAVPSAHEYLYSNINGWIIPWPVTAENIYLSLS